MSGHSDTQASETEDEYTREISHNRYRLDNQIAEPTFPLPPHMFHSPPLLSPSSRPLIMPLGFPPKPLPFILPPPPPPPIIPGVTEATQQLPHIMPLLPPISQSQSVLEIRPRFDPNNLTRFPPPIVPSVSQPEPQMVPPVAHEPPKISQLFDHQNILRFPTHPVSIISQSEGQKESPERHNVPQFPPHFDPKNFPLFPPPLMPNIKQPEPLKETHFVPPDTQDPTKFQVPIEPQTRPLFPSHVNPIEPPKATQLPHPETQNMPLFPPNVDPKNNIFLLPQLPPKPQNEDTHFEPQFRPIPHFQSHEQREVYLGSNEPQKEPHMELKPHLEPPFIPPELREKRFIPNESQRDSHHSTDKFQLRFSQPNFPHFSPPNLKQETQSGTEIFDTSPHSGPNQFPPNLQLEPNQFPPNLQLEPNQFPPNLQLEPNQFPPNLQLEPNQFPPNLQLEPNQFPPNLQPEPNQFRPSLQLEPNQFPPNLQPEPNQFRPNLQLEPNQFPPNFQPEPNQFPPNLPREPTKTPPDPQIVPTEMWQPISNENIRFPHPATFQPNPTQFPPTTEQTPDTSNMEPNEPQTPTTEPSQPPIVSQTDFDIPPQQQQSFPHYRSEEMEFSPDHEIPGPHYRSRPSHRPPFVRPPFQRPYGPSPRDQFYPPYPMRHPMGPPRPIRFRPVWTEHVTMDGRVYHYNHETMESFWEPPEFEEEPSPPFPHFNPDLQADNQGEIDMENPDSEPHDTIPHLPPTKPINSTPVPGSEWCVVWTNDDKVFFFNAVINKSVWQIPNEIKEHPIARKLMERNPDLPAQPIGMGTEIETESKRVKLMEPSVELEQDSSGNNSDEPTGESVEIILQQSTNVKTPKKVKSPKNEFAISEEDAKTIRALKPLEVRIIEYKEMLLQRGVSAFSTWEKEQPKVAFDPRYILLTAKERKPIFEQFSQERTHEEIREKNIKLKLRKERFFSLLSDAKVGFKTSFHEFKLRSSKDPRFKEIEKVKEREKLFLEYQANLKKKAKIQTKTSTSEAPEDQLQSYEARNSKKNRVEASIREREREVSESRRNQKRVIEDQRSLHKRDEAKIKYKSSLSEMIRDTKTSFKSFEKELKSHPDYDESINSLSSDERLNYFEHHIDFLQNKKRNQFQVCIDDCQEIDLSTSFKKARKLIKSDPRFEAISSSETKRETEYNRYLEAKIKQAGDDFNQLLRETKLITYKTKSNLDSNSKALQEIEYILAKDRRYLNLDCIQEERRSLLLGYINELSDRGIPPPPTATSPNRTRAK